MLALSPAPNHAVTHTSSCPSLPLNAGQPPRPTAGPGGRWAPRSLTCEQGGGQNPGEAEGAQEDGGGCRDEARGRRPPSPAEPPHRPGGAAARRLQGSVRDAPSDSGARPPPVRPPQSRPPAPGSSGKGRRGEQDGRQWPAGESHPTAAPGEGTVGAGKAAVSACPSAPHPLFPSPPSPARIPSYTFLSP